MKKGWKIFLIVFLILAGLFIILVGIAFYFYNYYSFYTARVCISNKNPVNLKVPCSSSEKCRNLLEKEVEQKSGLGEMPETIQEKFETVIEKAIYCNKTCKLKKMYGEGLGGVEHVEECGQKEKEIIYNVKGKDIIKLYPYLKEEGII